MTAGHMKAAALTRAADWSRFGWVLGPMAVGGALLCAGLTLHVYLLGGWPLYDTACFWVAGLRLREGVAIYGWVDPAFTFRYAPPWAVLWVPLSFIPLPIVSVGVLVAEILALRYVAGSWRNAGLLCWLPPLSMEFATGNVNLLMAAAILAGVRGSGVWPALFALAKFSPAVVLVRAKRRQWMSFALTIGVLCLLTLPVLSLWPEWIAQLDQPASAVLVPLTYRIPIGLALLAYRKDWSIAAAAAILSPALYPHSLVLFIPAIRLFVERLAGGPSRIEKWRRRFQRRHSPKIIPRSAARGGPKTSPESPLPR